MSIQSREQTLMVPAYNQREIALERGKGMYVWDEQGKKYLDLTSQYGVTILGHANKEINGKIKKQLDKMTACHRGFFNGARTEHCEKLKKYMPKKLNRFFLTNTGAETVEGALKFARLVTKRQQIISLTRGYHGRTLGALSATHAAKHRDGYGDLLPHFVFTDFDDLKELEKTISGKTAAVILEVLQGEGGIHLASKEFVKGVRKLCDKHGALMIVDEIQTGMGRTGKMWAFEHFAVVPDMVCISKGVGNGIPLGVLAVTEEISSKIHRGSHGATFAGGPLTAVAGIATLDYFQKHQILKRVRENGGYFLKKLKALKSPRIQEVRGLGLILGIELKEKAADFIKTLQKKGVLVLPAGENIIRVLPPYIITKEQIDKCIAMLKNVLK